MSDIVVIDCNVLVAGLITQSAVSPPARMVELALTGQIDFLLSDELVDEYRAVLCRPHLRRRHGKDERAVSSLLQVLVARGELLMPVGSIVEGPDPHDAHLWRLLRMRPEASLVTGDQALLLSAPEWARVVSPRVWLEAWQAHATTSAQTQSRDDS